MNLTIKDWWHDFLDLLFPRCCVICGRHLGHYEQKICASCLVSIPYVRNTDLYDNPAARLFWGKIPIEKAFCYIHYHSDSDSHELLAQLKYNHRPDLGVWCGRMMARDLEETGFFDDIDCILPLPLHWKRHIARGYNQSVELAKGVAEKTGLPVLTGYVRRVRNNETQTHKTMEERIKNVDGLFRLRRPIPYRHILLLDDVLTTSATLTSCAQAILKEQPDVCFSVLTLAKA